LGIVIGCNLSCGGRCKAIGQVEGNGASVVIPLYLHKWHIPLGGRTGNNNEINCIIMTDYLGRKYRMISQDKFDDYMKALGNYFGTTPSHVFILLFLLFWHATC
jgi:hypothetical protein